jgi:ADP-heptose:LPS heptosyltransferase
MKNIIFKIDGGIGKSIMATAVCEAIKKQYPNDKLIVITAYPDVFLCNPNVDKCYTHNNLFYFYQDFVDNKSIRAFLHDPYFETSFIKRESHLIETWCSMFSIKYNGEQPKLYLTDREVNFYANQFASDKPIFLIQTNGGGADQGIKYSWSRDIPQQAAQEIVNHYANNGFNVVHIRREDQIALQNTTPVSADFRAIASLIKLSSVRLFMDSFAQHTAAALDLPSTVLWIANTPEQFGYNIHSNITANAETASPELKNSVFAKYNIAGGLLEFPYNSESEIFDLEKIVKSIDDYIYPAATEIEEIEEPKKKSLSK